ncbi:small, acid-soluble spore protein L [Bacillus sp. WMMC1349]|nr:small, acid-soluble spore protein L [Bacillus sp. WMMC1349]
MIKYEVIHVEKQQPTGKGRLTGSVTPQGEIYMNEHKDPKTELENRAKKAIQNVREIDISRSLFFSFAIAAVQFL